MKKKILLCAGTILAAMIMTTSAFAAEIVGDVNGDGAVNAVDSALILNQALSKDYANSQAAMDAKFNLAVANLDEDKPFENTGEITANDAALAFKKGLGTKLYLDLKVGQSKVSQEVTMDTTVKEVVERFVGPDATYGAAYNKRKATINKIIGRIQFYSGNDVIGNVKIVEPEGWDIFGYAVRSLVKETPVYTKVSSKAIFDVYGGDVKTSNKIDELSLPVATNEGQNMDALTYEFVQATYQKGLGIVKLQPTAQDLIDAKNGVTDVTGDKYKIDVMLNNDSAKTYHYYSKADDTLDALAFEAEAAGILDYETVTIGKINDTMGKAKDENGVYGSVNVKVNARTGSATLVER